MTRTHDLLITNQLLYQLSYTSVSTGHLPIIHHKRRFVKRFASPPYPKNTEKPQAGPLRLFVWPALYHSIGANNRSRSRSSLWGREMDRQSSNVTIMLLVWVSRKSSRMSATDGVSYSSTPFSKWRNILR